MSKIIKPEHGVVYECYRGFTDCYGDRARRGQKFVVLEEWPIDKKEVVLRKASGRGLNIAIDIEKFSAHFCPAPDAEQKDAAPQDAEAPFGVEALLVEGTWDDVKEHLDDMPDFIKALLKRAKPELFEPAGPEAFKFKESGNTFSTDGFKSNTPFIVGKGLVNEEDQFKCLVVDRGMKAELFTGPRGHQCIRFVKDEE